MGIQTDIRDAIIIQMNTVVNVGNVLDKYIYANAQDTFLDNFAVVVDGVRQVRGWWFSIPTVYSATHPDSTFSNLVDTLDYAVYGIMSMSNNNDSATVFQDLIYEVRDAIRSEVYWTSTAETMYSTNVTIPTVDLRQFGSVLCHYCEMHVQVDISTPIVWEYPTP